jgi:hypothetical protein
MSRKHPSFDQLIDYMESERKLKSHKFSVFHNVYSRNTEPLKTEFSDNAKHLKFRKNGVYLYHEIISITRTQNIPEDEQKTILQRVVNEYLKARAKNNLAYAVLHEDKKDNLHFHIVISANEAQDQNRKRLSKADFAEIQTRLEKWVLETYPQLEQTAVFTPNLSEQQKQERETKRNTKASISNKGAELKKRTGATSEKDRIQTTLESIFETVTDGRHFAELLEKERLKIYQRGKQFGIIDTDGKKYRFSTLGLTEQWEALDQRMTEQHQTKTQPKETQRETPRETRQEKPEKENISRDTTQNKGQDTEKAQTNRYTEPKPEAKEQTQRTEKPPLQDIKSNQNIPDTDPIEEEAQRRLEEIEKIRAEKTAKAQTQNTSRNKNQSS